MLLSKLVYILGLVIAGPICIIIALMDTQTNGKSFIENFNNVFAFNNRKYDE